MGFSSRVETVTPAKAAKWLELNRINNRTIQKNRVARYARAMREGRWALTHQGVAFDEDGFLCDGQHRLLAVIEADVDVEMLVTRGVSPAEFAVIDTARTRSSGDVFHINGYQFRTTIAAAARVLWLAEMLPNRVWAGLQATAENDILLEVASRYPDIEKAAERATRIYRQTKIPSSSLTALFAQVIDDASFHGFADGVEDGADLRAGDPRLGLRKAYSGTSIPKGRIKQQHGYAVVVKAWNAYVRGDNIKLLRWGPAELPMPTVEGTP